MKIPKERFCSDAIEPFWVLQTVLKRTFFNFKELFLCIGKVPWILKVLYGTINKELLFLGV